MLNREISKEEASEALSVTNGENYCISIEAPTEAEIREHVRQITTRRAQGADNIPLETLKRYIETSAKFLHPLFADIWDMVEIPDYWKEG
jgi:hypothetical protein